jgi:hypothetical protein
VLVCTHIVGVSAEWLTVVKCVMKTYYIKAGNFLFRWRPVTFFWIGLHLWICTSISFALSCAWVRLCCEAAETVQINSEWKRSECCGEERLLPELNRKRITTWQKEKIKSSVSLTLIVHVLRRTTSMNGYMRTWNYQKRTSGWYK